MLWKERGTLRITVTAFEDKVSPVLETIHQTLAIIPPGFNELIMGLGFGWTAPTVQELTGPGSEIPLTTEQSSWVGSLMDFGRIFGPLISALFLDTLGRKLILRSSTLIFCVAWFTIVSYKTVWAIYLLRLLIGIGMGISDSSSCIYLAEVTSPKIRAFFCSITMVAFYCGESFEFLVGTYLSYDTVAIINASLSLVGFASTCLLIESPYFLVMKGNLEKAQKNYLWLKGTQKLEHVSAEFEQICQNLDEERKKKQSYRVLFKDETNRRTMIIVLILNSLSISSGYSAVTSYASKIFQPNETLSSNEFTILFGVLQTIASVVVVLIIERFNRRTLLLVSYLISAISHITTATLFYVHGITPIRGFSWLIFSSVSTYVCMYTLLYTILHTVRGELIPQSIRAIGGALAIVVHAFTGFLISKVFLQVSEMFGIYVNFLFYFVVSLTALIFVYFKLPETRGRTLVDIQKSMM